MSELPYERGELLRDTADDFTKLRRAWKIIERRGGEVFDFTGLERSLPLGDTPAALLNDELAPALFGDRLTALALEHLGGDPDRDDVFVANRMTAATVAAMQVMAKPGGRVVGIAPGHSHASVIRAVRLAGATFEEGGEIVGADVLVLTRLAVTYEALPLDRVEAAVEQARAAGVPVYLDDAGGARVGPAVLGQPRLLELGVDVGATGLDKYGTIGPRLGLLAGRRELVAKIRARAIELGLEARPMLWPGVVHTLEQYRPERVRELVATTMGVADALEQRLPWVDRTPVAVKLQGEDVLAEAARRAAVEPPALAPIEATAALAMLLLEEHGIHTVHFAALPPGTSALLIKFVSPETLARFGGAAAFAGAVDASLDALARLLGRPEQLAELLGRS